MKKVFKNKKVLVSMIMVCLLAASGITYAWFTANASAKANATMGFIRLSARQFEEYTDGIDTTRLYMADFIDNAGVFDQAAYETAKEDLSDDGFVPTAIWLDPAYYYQPTTEEDAPSLGFEIKNPIPDLNKMDTLPNIVKVGDLNGDLTIVAGIDDSGNAYALPDTDWVTHTNGIKAQIDAQALKIKVDESKIGYSYWTTDDGVDVGYAWASAVDPVTNVKSYYILLAPGAFVDTVTMLHFDGEVMGNEYAGSIWDFASKWQAKQQISAALTADWGITDMDLDMTYYMNYVAPPTSGNAQGRRAVMSFDDFMAKFFPDVTYSNVQ